MARLIDANEITYHKSGFPKGDGFDSRLDWAFREDIDKLPTVDAVEVVRCRDCKWYMPGDLFTDIMFCHRLKKENGKPAKYNFCEDDFCSYGERKDGDGNG